MSDNIYSQFFDQSTTLQNEDKIYYLLYQTTNLINQKIYVGKHVTKNLDDGYLGSGKLLKQAIRRYGSENFQREILRECCSIEELNTAEAEIITLDFVNREDTYNLTLGGNGGWHYVNTENKNNYRFKGKKHSVDTKQKISAKLRGKSHIGREQTLTEEGRQRISISSKQRMQGQSRTQETKQKIAETQKAKNLNPEIKQRRQNNMAIVRQKKPIVVADETKRKVSESLKKAYDEGKRQRKDYSFLQVDVDAGMLAARIEAKHGLWRGAVKYAYKQGHITCMPKRRN